MEKWGKSKVSVRIRKFGYIEGVGEDQTLTTSTAEGGRILHDPPYAQAPSSWQTAVGLLEMAPTAQMGVQVPPYFWLSPVQ